MTEYIPFEKLGQITLFSLALAFIVQLILLSMLTLFEKGNTLNVESVVPLVVIETFILLLVGLSLVVNESSNNYSKKTLV